MSEKAKAKKTKASAKKVSAKRATKKEDVDSASSTPKAVKSKKKTSKASASSTKTTAKKKVSKKTVAVVQEPEPIEDAGNPPLEEIFAKADNESAKSQQNQPEEKYASDAALSETLSPLDEVDSMQNLPSFGKEPEDDQSLKVKLSRSLLKKIHQQAEDEGLSIDDFVTELLAESVVLRAWEIVERKNQMRNPLSSSSPNNNRLGNPGNGNSNHNNGRGGHRKHRGGMSHGRYQSIMDDKATFLEYVRSQERSRR